MDDGSVAHTATAEAFLRERLALADCFASTAPGSTVVCGGWTARQLLAHVVSQERLWGFPLLAATPLVIAAPPRLRDHIRRTVLERPETRFLANSSYSELVARLRQPAPALFRLPGLVVTRLVEVWVHHEDIRRVQDTTPRDAARETDAQLWAAVRLLALRISLPSGVALRLATKAGGERWVGSRGRRTVSLNGDPGELLLYLMGRRAQSHAEVLGDPTGVADLEAGWSLL